MYSLHGDKIHEIVAHAVSLIVGGAPGIMVLFRPPPPSFFLMPHASPSGLFGRGGYSRARHSVGIFFSSFNLRILSEPEAWANVPETKRKNGSLLMVLFLKK